jgi:hypothetical protein
MVYRFVNDYVLLQLLRTLDARKDHAIQLFQQMKNSAQAVSLEVKAQHTMTEFDSYKNHTIL